MGWGCDCVPGRQGGECCTKGRGWCAVSNAVKGAGLAQGWRSKGLSRSSYLDRRARLVRYIQWLSSPAGEKEVSSCGSSDPPPFSAGT